MTTILNTLTDHALCYTLQSHLAAKGIDYEAFNTSDMNIAHCIGCNHCFLKTPGVCSVKDDYEPILQSLAHSDNVWLITGTSFGFISSQGKKVMDRLLPLLNMGLEFRNGVMRHTLRYGSLNLGIIYDGKGDSHLLNLWCERTASNLGGHSLGIFPIDQTEEVALCI